MNNSSGRRRGHRSPRLRLARLAAVITATAGLALVAAACGGSPSSTGSGGTPNAGGSATSSSAVAWIRCVRSHGVPDFPGLNGSGYIPKIISGQQVGVSDSRLKAAQDACQALWPYQAPTQAQLQQQLTDDVRFVQCVRSHGVPNLPDPIISDGRVEVVLRSTDGINVASPRIQAIARECQHVLPPGSPLPSATEAP